MVRVAAAVALAALLATAGADAAEVHEDGGVSLVQGRKRLFKRGSASRRLKAGPAASLAVDSSPAHLASGSAHAGVGAMKARFPYYHSSEEIAAEAKRLAAGCAGMLQHRTESLDNVSIDVVTVRASGASPMNKVFLMFGEHSRELISPESGLELMKMLCGETHAVGLSVMDILKDSEFKMVLNGNPRSRRQVESGNYCLRTNPDGVDLNRNWDEKWSSDSAYAGSDTNPGPKPFSEPETRIFKRLVSAYKPTTFVTVHSGTRGMYMPYAYDRNHLASRNYADMMTILEELDKSHCQCPYGAAGKEVGYSCPGTCLDWVYDNLDTPYSFAFEIYTSEDQDRQLRSRWEDKINVAAGAALLQRGESLAHPHFVDVFKKHKSDFVNTAQDTSNPSLLEEHLDDPDSCFRMFNPGTEETYKHTVTNWAQAYLELSQRVVRSMRNNVTVWGSAHHQSWW